MKITATKPAGSWQVTIDGHPTSINGAARILKINKDTIGKALRDKGGKGLMQLVKQHKLWDRLGVTKGTKLYKRGKEYAWSKLIVETSGVCGSHAYRLLKAWAAYEIDCDELFRPPRDKVAMNKKRATDGASTKRGAWDLGDMQPRTDIMDMVRSTKHDRECFDQDTTICLPGSGRSSGGPCRY